MGKTITFKLYEFHRTLDYDEVLAAARAAIKEGLPAEARLYWRWAVEIDGVLIGAKWLFSQVTGIPARRFQSQQAVYQLGNRLGLSVVKIQEQGQSPASGIKQSTLDDEDALAKVQGILVQEIERVENYLLGRVDSRPSDEKLCDWIHFCYTFELYAEARELFALVDQTQVIPWYYERTKKIAKICAMRAP